MAAHTTRGSAGLEEREAQLDTTLAALQEQRWALSEASYERSLVRSRRGDCVGAFVDAKAALAFWPGEAKYLIRAAQASYDNGLLHKASKLFKRAQQAVAQETFNTVGTVEAMQATLAALAALDRRLRPFLRHVTHEHVVDRAIPGDMEGVLLPRLECIEAPADVIIALPTVPPLVIVRFDDQLRAEGDCAALADWLLALDSKTSPRSLTLMASHEVVQKDFFDLIIETLTPSCAQTVVCPRLTELRLLHRTAYERNSVGIPYSLDPTPLPIPMWREEWQVEAEVAGVLQLATERLRLSQGLPPTEDEASVAESSSILAASGTAGPDTTSSESATAWGECEALSSVELEGCYVDVDVWESMKSSATLFKSRPDPDEMVKLPRKKEEMARRKKRKFNFHHLF